MDVQKYSYHIVPAKSFISPQSSKIIEEAFDLWWNVWSQVYSQSEFKLVSEEFLRQDLICSIQFEDRVIAAHLYSFYDLSSSADVRSKYFQFFSETFFGRLREKDVRHVMSMEYLTVHPDYRSSVIGVSLGKVLGQLGVRLFEQTRAGAIVAPARKDLKVHEMAYESGFICIEPDVNQRGFPCDMIACLQGSHTFLKDPLAHTLSDALWSHRAVAPACERYFRQRQRGQEKAA